MTIRCLQKEQTKKAFIENLTFFSRHDLKLKIDAPTQMPPGKTNGESPPPWCGAARPHPDGPCTPAAACPPGVPRCPPGMLGSSPVLAVWVGTLLPPTFAPHRRHIQHTYSRCVSGCVNIDMPPWEMPAAIPVKPPHPSCPAQQHPFPPVVRDGQPITQHVGFANPHFSLPASVITNNYHKPVAH